MNFFELRNDDYTLSDEQRALEDSCRQVLSRNRAGSTSSAGDFDDAVWQALLAVGVLEMGIPSKNSPAEASLVDLVLVAHACGKHLAPVPYIDAVVAGRLLAACAPDSEAARAATTGAAVFQVSTDAPPALLPPDSGYDGLLGLDDNDLWLHTASAPGADGAKYPRTQRVCLGSGPHVPAAHEDALALRRLLSAAALAGIVAGALAKTVEFVRNRATRGTPLGALQAVSHPLVDVALAADTARNLTLRAAWYAENDPGAKPWLTNLAFVHAVRASRAATAACIHLHGGFGVCLEAVISQYYLRAKRLATSQGDPEQWFDEAAQHLAVALNLRGDVQPHPEATIKSCHPRLLPKGD